jgi:hypothetical protein
MNSVSASPRDRGDVMTPDYSNQIPPEPSHRSASAWLVLLSAWVIGLLIWSAYVAAYVYFVIWVLV